MALTNDLIFKAWCLLLRKCSNWTQEDLAGEACLSIGTIQRVERSTIEGFSDDTKRKYAKAYGYGDEHFLIGSPFYDELRYFLRQVSQPHTCGFCLARKRQQELHPYVVEFLERSLPEGLLETIPDKPLLNYWKSFARQLDLSDETIQESTGKSISLSELNAHIQKYWPVSLNITIPVFKKSAVRLIVIVGNKGGTGRTILASGLLAVTAALGRNTGIVHFLNPGPWEGVGEVPTAEVITYNESRIEEALAAGHDFLFVDASRSLDSRLVGLCDIADLILCPVGRTRETDRHSSLETDSLLRTWAFLSKQLGPEKLDRCFRGVLSDHIDARESARMDMLEAESLQIDTTPKFSDAVQHIFVGDSHIKFLKNSVQHSTSSWRIYSWLRRQEPDLCTLSGSKRRKRNQVSDGLKRLLEDEACEDLLFDFAALLDEMNGIFRESDKTSDDRPTTLFQLLEKMTQLRQEQFDSHV